MQPLGLNDGYAYRCEVWYGRRLIKANTYAEDSWTAEKTSITENDNGSVTFNIDSYSITLGATAISSDSVWSGGGHE